MSADIDPVEAVFAEARAACARVAQYEENLEARKQALRRLRIVCAHRRMGDREVLARIPGLSASTFRSDTREVLHEVREAKRAASLSARTLRVAGQAYADDARTRDAS